MSKSIRELIEVVLGVGWIVFALAKVYSIAIVLIIALMLMDEVLDWIETGEFKSKQCTRIYLYIALSITVILMLS